MIFSLHQSDFFESFIQKRFRASSFLSGSFKHDLCLDISSCSK